MGGKRLGELLADDERWFGAEYVIPVLDSGREPHAAIHTLPRSAGKKDSRRADISMEWAS